MPRPQGYISPHIKQLQTSVPKDMRKAKEARAEARAEAKAQGKGRNKGKNDRSQKGTKRVPNLGKVMISAPQQPRPL